MNLVELSVVVPVYNEEDNIEELVRRLSVVLDSTKKTYEVIFVDDGSKDRSFGMLRICALKNPSFKVIRFNRNYGQHSAIFAGFSHARGDVVVTLDADLQNPPEEIPKLLHKMEEGYEVVSGYRQNRQDSLCRKIPSFFVALITSKLVGVQLRDYGCMLRAYRKELVRLMCENSGASTYIPALANSFASSVTEVSVHHEHRRRGKSKYGLLSLLRLNFDLMTSFSLLPIQMIGVVGFVMSLFGLGFSLFLLLMRLVKGSEWAVQGTFTLFGILFFFVGVQVLSMALIGEYIGRIYQEVRSRPRYRIQEIFSYATANTPTAPN